MVLRLGFVLSPSPSPVLPFYLFRFAHLVPPRLLTEEIVRQNVAELTFETQAANLANYEKVRLAHARAHKQRKTHVFGLKQSYSCVSSEGKPQCCLSFILPR